MTTTAAVVLHDGDRTEAATNREVNAIPALYIDGVSIQIAGTADQVTVADALLAAVTEWHAEIHRRAAERAEAGR